MAFLFNNILVNNLATNYGGAIYMDYSLGNAPIINNTIVQNHANYDGGGIFFSNSNNANFINTILYGNTSGGLGPQIRISSSASWLPKFYHCDIQGGLAAISPAGVAVEYQNNLDINPQFINADANNFRLSAGSLLIDAGTTSSSYFPQTWNGANNGIIHFPTADYEGNPRVISTIDIGAFEYDNNLDMPNIPEKNQVTAYPNPVRDVLYFNSRSTITAVEIYDPLGRNVDRITISNNTVNISHLKQNLYFLKVFFENKTTTIKVIKE